MRITESKLRKVIRSVIRESSEVSDSDSQIVDCLNKLVEAIKKQNSKFELIDDLCLAVCKISGFPEEESQRITREVMNKWYT